MAMDTVQTIRNAETQAIQKEKDAVKECETVISKSREEADEMLAAIRLSAQEQANEKLEQAELKAKIEAENAAVKKQMDGILTAAIVSKSGHARYEYIDKITDIGFQLAFENHSDKDIAGFKGIISFKDMFGDTIKNLTLSYDDGVKAKSTAKYEGSTAYHEFMAEDSKLLNTDLDKIKFEFKPSVIMFTDGTKIELKHSEQD